MAVQIPWQDSADFQFEVSLDRFVYMMRLRWNDAAQSWALDLFTRSKTPLVLGTRLVASADLLRLYTGDFTLPGALFVIGEPSLEAFVSGSASLVYLTEAEVLAL